VTGRAKVAGRIAFVALLVLASVHYGWNARHVAPLASYDAGGHAAYVLTIADEGRLPHPLEGWSTFHPPTYYLVAAGVWRALESAGPRALLTGLRAISAFAILGCGVVAFIVLRSLGYGPAVAVVAAALVFFTPVAQMASVMIGNEPLAAFFATLALLCLVRLQATPRDLGAAALAGLCAGLALATKYTGLYVALACVVPFVRRDIDGRLVRSAAVCLACGLLVVLPVYLRNVAITGTATPVTRTLQPMRGIEEAYVLRPRRVGDYLWVPFNCLRRPSIIHLDDGPPRSGVWNTSMQSVWGLTYASLWYDAFTHRIPLRFHHDGIWAGPTLTLLGLVPTGIMLFGFGGALVALVRQRGRSPDAPLVVMAVIALAAVTVITWFAPAMVAVKGSYLLSLILPAAVFFARGVSALPGPLRVGSLVISTTAAAAAALVFTTGLVFPAEFGSRFVRGWEVTGSYLPGARIEDAARLVDPMWLPNRRPRSAP